MPGPAWQVMGGRNGRVASRQQIPGTRLSITVWLWLTSCDHLCG
jgi:hypothetical protein